MTKQRIRIRIGKGIGIAIGVLVAIAATAEAETAIVEAGRDATLIEDPEGALANGAGPVFFVGRTNQRQNSVRRGMLYFDVAAALPDRAVVERVRLVLFLSPSNPNPSAIGLHRLLSAWGEGPSFATGGGGDLSSDGDATWIHTFYDDETWTRPGGQFVARASSVRAVSASGFYVWQGAQKMVADVRLWLSAPHRNFGWMLIGDENTPQNAKSFSSREDPDPSLRPILEVTYHLPGRSIGP